MKLLIRIFDRAVEMLVLLAIGNKNWYKKDI